MPFTCSICQGEIRVGDPMLSDEKMNVAHEGCVRKATGVPREPAVVSSSLSAPLLPVPPPPRPVCSVCSVCGVPCIGACPTCRAFVCQAFGMNSRSCGLAHEARCEDARRAREIDRPAAGAPPVVRPDRRRRRKARPGRSRKRVSR